MRLECVGWWRRSSSAPDRAAAWLGSRHGVGRGVRTVVVAVAVAVVSLTLGASPGLAAFPGANGMLVVQPVGGGSGLILATPDGGQLRRICSDVACGPAIHPAWSADGQEIVYAGPAGTLSLVYADGRCLTCGAFAGGYRTPVFTVGGDVLAADARGVERLGIDGLPFGRVLTGAASAAVSSVDGRLAFVRSAHGRNEVFVTDRSGSHLSQLTRKGVGSPSWAPDGRTLAVVHSGVVELVDLRGHVLRRLARGGSPAFSPDGRWVAYIGRGGRIMLVPVGGGSPRPVGKVRGTAVDWQPVPRQPPSPCVPLDGSTVAVSSADGLVTSRTRGGSTAYMACSRSSGHMRYLGASNPPDPSASDDLFSYLGGVGLAGDYVAFFSYQGEQYHGGVIDQTAEVSVLNLFSDSTFSIDVDVPDTFYPWADPNSSVTIVLTAQPLLAWETTAPSPDSQGLEETISAQDSQGTHNLDSETVTNTAGLANLAIAGNEVTWTHDGQPRSATLQP